MSEAIKAAIHALKKDLLRDSGPQISTVRNYNFAILPYEPAEEFGLRRQVDDLSRHLQEKGWMTATVDLQKLLIERLSSQEPGFISTLIDLERRLSKATDPNRPLRALKERVVTLIEGPNGLAKEVVSDVRKLLAQASDARDRTVIFLGRAGALYPFLRTSALLKHVTGQTDNAPVVLLYPGTVDAEGGLSFMGELPPDRDYRCRIYR